MSIPQFYELVGLQPYVSIVEVSSYFRSDDGDEFVLEVVYELDIVSETM